MFRDFRETDPRPQSFDKVLTPREGEGEVGTERHNLRVTGCFDCCSRTLCNISPNFSFNTSN